ncbi:hypothetical protein [Paenirhodobacter sp.]|uniref:hypothetical protein n=1 Tax=Paenirhodobacter sp. TaxID=1965326 RepID=UPI003B3E1DD4
MSCFGRRSETTGARSGTGSSARMRRKRWSEKQQRLRHLRHVEHELPAVAVLLQFRRARRHGLFLRRRGGWRFRRDGRRIRRCGCNILIRARRGSRGGRRIHGITGFDARPGRCGGQVLRVASLVRHLHRHILHALQFCHDAIHRTLSTQHDARAGQGLDAVHIRQHLGGLAGVIRRDHLAAKVEEAVDLGGGAVALRDGARAD